MAKYDEKTKEDLLVAVADRKSKGSTNFTGVNSASNKGDIIFVLELDDESLPEQPPAPLPPLKASSIPVVEPELVVVKAPGDVPDDEGFDKGIFVEISSGEKYALAISEDALNGRTHFLKNSIHFHNCTKADFKELFEKA